MSDVTVTLCTTCQREERGAGLRLHDALSQASLDGVRLRGAKCLSACSRACTMVLSGGAERWTYIYGDLDPERDLDDLVAGIRAYRDTPDGLVPWRARPVIFRKQSIARIPPQNDPQE